VELQDKIIEAAKEIFSTMIMMEIDAGSSAAVRPHPLADSISGVIGLAGTRRGVLAIHLPYSVAFAITGNFLGMEIAEMNTDVEDAIGELANMMGGSLKAFLSEKGRDINLSMPSTISGRKYAFEPTSDAEILFIPFSSEAGDFMIELQLEK
jgi:chemotaxis protein CheX